MYALNGFISQTFGHYSGPVSSRVLRSRRCTHKCKSHLAYGLNWSIVQIIGQDSGPFSKSCSALPEAHAKMQLTTSMSPQCLANYSQKCKSPPIYSQTPLPEHFSKSIHRPLASQATRYSPRSLTKALPKGLQPTAAAQSKWCRGSQFCFTPNDPSKRLPAV